jgi:hypothetical protein
MSETSNIRRVGSAEVVSKNGEDLWVHIQLNAAPNLEWLQCFKDPISYETRKSHPSNARFTSADAFDFESTMSELKNDIKWVDKYLEQANAACIAKKDKELAEKRRKEDLADVKKEEIKKINESIKGL